MRHVEKGFSLIEVLITLVILSVVTVALTKVMLNSYNVSQSVFQQREVTNILASRMNLLKYIDTDDITSGGTFGYAQLITGSGANVTGTYGVYTTTWAVDSSDPSFKEIDVTVSWTDSDGVDQSEELSNIIRAYDPGIQEKAFNDN